MSMEGISAAVSALRVAGRRVAQTGHNLANANTTGFTPSRLEQADTAAGGVQISGSSQGQPGPIVPSGQPLDLAIDGGGFFPLSGDGGQTVYTRSGHFVLDADRNLTDASGRALRPGIKVHAQATSVHITSDGVVQSLGDDGQVLSQAQIETAKFGNPGGLQAMGGNVFQPTAASGPAANATPGTPGHGHIISGAYQGSGTDIAREMVNLITDQRSFEANTKTIQAFDEMLGAVLDIKS